MSESKAEDAVAKVRPLSREQSRALQKLVDNDFRALTSELQTFVSDQVDTATEQVRLDYAARNRALKDLGKKAQRLVDDFEKKRRALMEEAADAGARLTVPHLVYDTTYDRKTGRSEHTPIEATDDGMAEAIQEAVTRVQRDGRRASEALERARIETQRRVLLASITREAEDILASLPTPQSLMAAEQAKQQEKLSQ